MRLDKMLAHLGIGSRKEVKKLIRDGYILVNGEIIRDDDFVVDEENDEVIFNDVKLEYEDKVYILLNKPAGVVCATEDNFNETVVDLVSEYRGYGIFPVGRLDKDTEGLLLLTNDGPLAHELLSPKKHVSKVYEVTCDKIIPEELVDKFAKGVVLEDGYKCKEAKLFDIKDNKCNVEIYEGKFHQVKRMFLMHGLEVTYLKRVKFGKLSLPSDLELGDYIKVNREDI